MFAHHSKIKDKTAARDFVVIPCSSPTPTCCSDTTTSKHLEAEKSEMHSHPQSRTVAFGNDNGW